MGASGVGAWTATTSSSSGSRHSSSSSNSSWWDLCAVLPAGAASPAVAASAAGATLTAGRQCGWTGSHSQQQQWQQEQQQQQQLVVEPCRSTSRSSSSSSSSSSCHSSSGSAQQQQQQQRWCGPCAVIAIVDSSHSVVVLQYNCVVLHRSPPGGRWGICWSPHPSRTSAAAADATPVQLQHLFASNSATVVLLTLVRLLAWVVFCCTADFEPITKVFARTPSLQ